MMPARSARIYLQHCEYICMSLCLSYPTERKTTAFQSSAYNKQGYYSQHSSALAADGLLYVVCLNSDDYISGGKNYSIWNCDGANVFYPLPQNAHILPTSVTSDADL